MNKIKDQLQYCLSEFDIENFGEKYRGKVRDNFHFKDKIYVPGTRYWYDIALKDDISGWIVVNI